MPDSSKRVKMSPDDDVIDKILALQEYVYLVTAVESPGTNPDIHRFIPVQVGDIRVRDATRDTNCLATSKSAAKLTGFAPLCCFRISIRFHNSAACQIHFSDSNTCKR
jgi:hypothetical protein